MFRSLTALFILLFLFSSYVSQASDLILDARGSFQLGAHLFYFQDDNHTSLEKTTEINRWQKVVNNKVSFGFSDSQYWFKSIVVNHAEQHKWFLKIAYPPIDYIDLYLCDTETVTIVTKQCVLYESGDQRPFAQRERNNPNFILPLTLNVGKNYLYIHMKTEGSYQLPAEIMDQKTLDEHLNTDDFIRGGYLTVMIVMVFYNVFIFLMTRDNIYFLYSATVLSFLLFFMTYGGSAFQYLWPDSPKLNEQSLPFTMLLNQLVTIVFITKFLRVTPTNKIGFYYYRLLLFTVAIFLLLTPILSYKTLTPIMSVLSIVISASAFTTGVYYWRLGHSEARLFTIAWGTLVIGMIASNLRILGIFPSNFFTLHGYQLGSFLEIILLSLSLGERIQKLQYEKTAADQKAVEAHKESIFQLQKYEALYQHSLSGQFQLDNQKKIISSNPSLQSMLGYSTEQALVDNVETFTELIVNKQDSVDLFEQLNVQAFELALIHKQGHIITTLITLSQNNNDGQIIWHGSIIDISAKKQRDLLHEKAQAEKMNSLHHLVTGISHEVSTPIGNIAVACSVLQDSIVNVQSLINKKVLTQKQLSHAIELQTTTLGIIEHGTRSLSELTGIIKECYIDPSEYPIKVFNIKHMLTAWQVGLSTEPKVCITCPDNITLNNSRLALIKVLQQLLDNSKEHNAALLSAQTLSINITVIQQGKYIDLIYEDNGCGIKAGEAKNIFLPFYTSSRASNKKLGLGLYLVNNIVTTVFHGTISIDHQQKNSLVFILKIPVS